ncbi:inosine triphosphate pyrophosphatase-like protein [Tribonema minus]|uniref:Inosine triphosphate pyrophosphatase-like protein n=1 Tax=Tribonema minus TaxID=303371 RepID=A0A836CIZ2_9STRA|nr:inosine triphosphate pyrophosphatase-like protein [Tribonema minus]
MMSAATQQHSTLLAHKAFMDGCRVVLASKSPRRKEIFGLMGLDERLEVIVSEFEEDLRKADFPQPGDYAAATAKFKAAEVAAKVLPARSDNRPTIVVGSDTIVELDGTILEKPDDAQHAFRMLKSLSGRRHLVHSGVAVFTGACGSAQPAACWYDTTSVEFLAMSDDEIWAYVESGEPMDKAGAYGIQGLGGQFVKGVEGCYFNVMGFPMSKFGTCLAKLIESGKV